MENSKYHQSELEQVREKDLIGLLKLLPKGMKSVLEIGARDKYYSRILTGFFEGVTALDLVCPNFQMNKVTTVKGDVTRLDFPPNSFDCVVATEVLEHVPNVERACREISRVARQYVVIGVPYKQDIRVGRTTCLACGQISPPWGHVNTFDKNRLMVLFPAMKIIEMSFAGAGENRSRTNFFSSWLMDIAGNPWGTYGQEEPCVKCGAKLIAPPDRSTMQRICSAIAYQINLLHCILTKPCPNWIHLLLRKN